MKQNKKRVGKNVMTAVLLILGAANIFPFIFMLSASFKPLNEIFVYPVKLIPEHFITSNYKEVFSAQYSFVRWYFNTFVMVGTILVLKVGIVTLTAYAFARLRFKGRDILFVVLLSSMMIPPDAVIIPKYVIFKAFGITDSMWSSVLPSIFDVFFVFMVRQFFLGIPETLSEAAIIDGCGHFKIYSQIVLPLAKPAVITMILSTFIWAWNDYMGPYIFITTPAKQMLSVGIKMFQVNNSVDYGLQMAAATMVLIPIIVMFLFSQRYFIEGIATSGMKN